MNLSDKCWCGGIFKKSELSLHLEDIDICIDVSVDSCPNCGIYNANSIDDDEVKRNIEIAKREEEYRLKCIADKREENKKYLIDSGIILPERYKDNIDGFIRSIEDHSIQEITFKVTEGFRRIGIAYSYDASYADLDDHQLSQLRDRIDSWLKRDTP